MCGANSNSARPRAIIEPQVVREPIPAPRRLSEPSATMTTPMARNAIDIREGKTLGTICRVMIFTSRTPIDLAAITNSRLIHAIAEVRAMRPKIGTMTTVREMMTTCRRRDSGTGVDGSRDVARIETSVRARSKFGTESTTLKTPDTTRSSEPFQ